MDKPSILLVPGSFALPVLYEGIVSAVAAHGYETKALHPPSVGLDSGLGREGSLPSMYDDAAFIANEIEKLADDGKEIVAIAHSYGGHPLSECVKGLVKGERQKQGEKGGLVRLAYVSCLVPAVGLSPITLLEGVPVEQRDEVLLNVREALTLSFLLCEDDLVIPATVQRDVIEMIEKESGNKVDVTSHPYYSLIKLAPRLDSFLGVAPTVSLLMTRVVLFCTAKEATSVSKAPEEDCQDGAVQLRRARHHRYFGQALATNGSLLIKYDNRGPGSDFRGFGGLISPEEDRWVFIPESYDASSAQKLPTLFTIHGGGFTIGSPHDNDKWNSSLTRMHDILVIGLNYRKAPWYPFPTGLHDIEALLLAAIADASLPIDRDRVAIGGFSAGGNLALAASQLPSVREHVRLRAAVSLYPVVDYTVPPEAKLAARHYKPLMLGPGSSSATAATTSTNGNADDYLRKMAPFFDWSYLPVGQDLRDPLLSPYLAARSALPPHVFVLGAELDMLAHEAWRLASKLTGGARPVPTLADKVGQEKPAAEGTRLILDDERFSFEHVDADGERSVRWLLVPDQIHGFDVAPPRLHGSEEAFRDAGVKATAYQKLLGEWLFDRAWKQ
ncbi:hypothetical protein SLS62_010472 [Diatrype stigma]|uniref:Alpha/beta hydrolase fold-3 domain-containing protein n=1 Tax=Diatrype stigma TaxID=117547 RepID=A0AAN9UC95_9PEZI